MLNSLVERGPKLRDGYSGDAAGEEGRARGAWQDQSRAKI